MSKSSGAFGESTLPRIAGVEDSNINADINVTPMIDVMLVLLIIFMVIIPAMAYAAKLPSAATAAPEKDERVTLGISNTGQYYLDKEGLPTAPENLARRLQEKYALRPEDHVLYMKSDENIPYGVVLTAIEAARIAGVRRIGAITEGVVETPGATE